MCRSNEMSTRLGVIAICRADLQTLMMELDDLFLCVVCLFY
jgi:hypothetical protein